MRGQTGNATLNVRLRIDWKALGLDPTRAKLTVPAIGKFQSSAELAPGQPIPVEPAKGALLVVHE